MKRLVILTAAVLVAGVTGCKHCGLCGGGGGTAVYRPACPSPCGTGVDPYPASGGYAVPGGAPPGVMTVPQSIPAQTIPGPEVYTPAN